MLSLLVLLACSGDPAPTPPPAEAPTSETSEKGVTTEADGTIVETSPPPLPTASLTDAERTRMRACSTNDECIAIDIDCCNLCNGGTAMPLNKAHVDEAKSRLLASKDCTAATCGDVPCEMPSTICHENVCAFSMAVHKPKPMPSKAE